jgi:hypothetical protein
VDQLADPEQKRAALDEVLHSRTFERSDQLKAFLRFVCEEEIAGHSEDLHEYQIGVDVLGRSVDYSPAEDAIVRNRAYALRRKLEEYYANENPRAAVRIEIPRGGYVPRFLSRDAPLPAEDRGPAAPVVPAAPAGRKRNWMPWVWFLAGVVMASALAWWWMVPGRPRPLAPILREAWGPLADPNGRTMVHIAAPMHLFVRPTPTRVPFNRPEVDSRLLREWYNQFPALPPAESLYLRPTPNSLLWGDALGMVTVGRILTLAGVTWEVVPNRVAGGPVLRKRNVILFGRPEYSREAGQLLRNTPLTVEFNPDLREYAILDRGAQQWLKPTYGQGDYAGVVYGLITVLPSEGSPAGDFRTVLLTGSNSAGIQAAAEYFSSEREMAALRDRFAGRRFPGAYQVVVRATASATIALDLFYETHRVLAGRQ